MYPNYKKRFISLLLVIALLASMGLNVFADTESGAAEDPFAEEEIIQQETVPAQNDIPASEPNISEPSEADGAETEPSDGDSKITSDEPFDEKIIEENTDESLESDEINDSSEGQTSDETAEDNPEDLPENELNETDPALNITLCDLTNGKAQINLPSPWLEGENEFEVSCEMPAAVFIKYANDTYERLYCEIVDEENETHRFTADITEDDVIYVFIKGDVDCNGRINATDATRMAQYLAGSYNPEDIAEYILDIDQNNRVNGTDMTRLNQYLMGALMLKWDIRDAEKPDPIDPDPIDPEPDPDPNENAYLILSADCGNGAEVTSGTEINFTLDADIVGDYEVEYIISAIGNVEATIRFTGDKSGYTTIADDSDGMTITAIATTASGLEIESNTVTVLFTEPVQPIDPNKDAVLILSTESDDEIYTRTTVHFDLSNDIVGDYTVEYFLTADTDETDAVTVYSDAYGCDIAFGDTAAAYTLIAVATTESGLEIESNSVTLTVTGPKPDPNENAYLTLAADCEDEIHIGTSVRFTLDTDITGDYTVGYNLTKNNGRSDTNVTNTTENGCEATFGIATGVYTLIATAVTETGFEIESNPVTVTVTNTAPVITNISIELDYNDITSGYVSGVRIWTNFEISAEDADGDKLTLRYVAGENYVPGNSTYLDEGDYVLGVYAVDQWGAKSETVYREFHVGLLDNVPLIYMDKEYVHIGEVFDVHVDRRVLEDKISIWTLYDPEGDVVEFDQSNLLKNGGKMSIVDGTGIYVLHALGIDEYGVPFDMETIDIDVRNDVPTGSIGHHVISDDFENPFTDAAKIHVIFDTAAVDPDGDEANICFINDDGEFEKLIDGYYTQGDYIIDVYPVDEWGLAGNKIAYGFTVSNVKPDEPVFIFDIDYSDWQYVNGELQVYVRPYPILNDPDHNPVDIVWDSDDGYKAEGYYPAGNYTMKGKAIDAWNECSPTVTEIFTVDLEAPFLAVNGEINEAEVHIGRDFEVTASVGALSAVSVSYELTETDGTPIEHDFSSFGMTGGDTNVSLGTGDYILKATAELTNDVIANVGEVLLHVTNAAPSRPEVRIEMDYNDMTSVNGVLTAFMNIIPSSTDPDGDAVEYVYLPGSVPGSSYVSEKTHKIIVIARDEWGAESEPAELEYTVVMPEHPWLEPEELEIHIGTEFNVTVHPAALKIVSTEYVLSDSDGMIYAVQNMGKLGGAMSVEYACGTYRLRAIVTLEDGSKYVIGPSVIEVVNMGPTAVVTGHAALPKSYNDGKITVHFDIDSADADNDAYKVLYSLDDTAWVECEYTDFVRFALTPGSHVLKTRAVDQWGMYGPVSEYPFDAPLYVDEDAIPVITPVFTDTFENGYKPGAKRLINFDIEWANLVNPDHFDLDKVEIFYMVDGEYVETLNDFYALGDYVIEVYAEDILGAKTQIGRLDLKVANETPVARLYVEDNELIEEISDDEPNLLQIKRTNGGMEIESFDELGYGTFELTLTVTDPWGEEVFISGTYTIASPPPVLSINGHEVTNHNPDKHLGYVEFDFTATPYDTNEYTLYYTFDGEEAPGLNDWMALGKHTVTVQAIHNVAKEFKSNLVTYTFELVNTPPANPTIIVTPDMNNIRGEAYTYTAEVYHRFSVDDPQSLDIDKGDQVTVHWLADGVEVTSPDNYFGVNEQISVSVYVTDLWGERSDIVDYLGVIKNEAPVIPASYVFTNPAKTQNGKAWASFTTTVNEPDGDLYKLFYKVDNVDTVGEGSPDGYYTPKAHPEMTENPDHGPYVHSVRVYAVDIWGEHSNIYEYTWCFDSTSLPAPPISWVYKDRIVANQYTSGATTGTILTADTSMYSAGTTIYWELPTGVVTGTSVPMDIGGNPVTVRCWAVDEMGNRSPASSMEVSVENTKPVISANYEINENKSSEPYTVNAKAWIDFIYETKGSDSWDDNAPVKVFWSRDRQTWTDWKTANPSSLYEPADLDIYVKAIDVWGIESNVYRLHIDFENKPPKNFDFEAEVDRGIIQNAYQKTAKAYTRIYGVYKDDDVATMMMSVDGGEYVKMGSIFLAPGDHAITAYAIDFWGATSATVTKKVTVQNRAPQICTSLDGSYELHEILNPYTTNAKVSKEVTVDPYDPDRGDAATLKIDFKFDGKSVAVGDKVEFGPNVQHFISITATDIFGETATYNSSFVITPDIPVINGAQTRLYDQWTDPYTTNAKQRVDVQAYVTCKDPVKTTVKIDGTEMESISGFYALGSHDVKVCATSIWGIKAEADKSFELTNIAPSAPEIHSTVNYSDNIDPFTTDCKVKIDVIVTGGEDPEGYDIIYRYADDSIQTGYYGLGDHTAKVCSVDKWGATSPWASKVTKVETDEPSVELNSSTLGDNFGVPSGTLVNFEIAATSKREYKLAAIDYYNTSHKPAITRTSTGGKMSEYFTNGRHLVVVQIKNLFGLTDYSARLFAVGPYEGSGTAAITSMTTSTSSEIIYDGSTPIAYVSGFTFDIPAINGHSSGCSDSVTVKGVTKTGATEIVYSFHTNDGYAHIDSNGSYRYTPSGSSISSGNWSGWNGEKYIKLIFSYTVADGHESCLASVTDGMKFTVNYTFIKENLGNFENLFD